MHILDRSSRISLDVYGVVKFFGLRLFFCDLCSSRLETVADRMESKEWFQTGR